MKKQGELEMLKWGKTKRIQFYVNSEKTEQQQQPALSSSSDYVKATENQNQIQVFEDEQVVEEEEDDGEEEEEPKTTNIKVHYRKRKLIDDVDDSTRKNKKKDSIDRWSRERYKLAEVNMLKILKEKEAVFGKPILRPALRAEARKVIGDTGLLDHLLKHMAGKVAPGGKDRFRRRHNADGAMEYWLESSDLVDIRKQAGVDDPYWTPPPGWCLGDSPNQDPVCAKEFKKLKQEIANIRRDMKELVFKRQEGDDIAVVVTTPSSCVTNTQNLENLSDRLLILLKEMHTDLVIKKANIEEMYADVVKKKAKVEEQLKETSKQEMEKVKSSSSSGETKEVLYEQKNDKQSGDKKATTTEDKYNGGKSSAFRICKPHGTFLWPNMAMMSPSPRPPNNIIVPLATPPSVSSSTSSSSPQPHLLSPHLQQNVPLPSSCLSMGAATWLTLATPKANYPSPSNRG